MTDQRLGNYEMSDTNGDALASVFCDFSVPTVIILFSVLPFLALCLLTCFETGKRCQVDSCMRWSKFWKMYFWEIHASRIALAVGSWLIQDHLFPGAALIQWLINTEVQRPSPFSLTQNNSEDPFWLPSFPWNFPRCLSCKPNSISVSQSSFQGTQTAGHSLTSFLFQLSSWVLYFLMPSWHLLPPFSQELTWQFILLLRVSQSLSLLPVSLILTTIKHSSVTCLILLA